MRMLGKHNPQQQILIMKLYKPQRLSFAFAFVVQLDQGTYLFCSLAIFRFGWCVDDMSSLVKNTLLASRLLLSGGGGAAEDVSICNGVCPQFYAGKTMQKMRVSPPHAQCDSRSSKDVKWPWGFEMTAPYLLRALHTL